MEKEKSERSVSEEASIDVFNRLKNLKISVSDDFDEKKELLEALDEKYGKKAIVNQMQG